MMQEPARTQHHSHQPPQPIDNAQAPPLNAPPAVRHDIEAQCLHVFNLHTVITQTEDRSGQALPRFPMYRRLRQGDTFLKVGATGYCWWWEVWEVGSWCVVVRGNRGQVAGDILVSVSYQCWSQNLHFCAFMLYGVAIGWFLRIFSTM
ncbi:hypothetical protein T440DRAFT_23437 [Plenodomus tracheiphilus IPT5]|uniref:Uncharacterized protein n=1 Tax=Plenodomus tracheiphilus IPT5 TaxID=1408161 RepID=A0A6A7BBV7_9PLEO|nr:hypothetical protein T440DRAFT_23437 [Plenodomus tracheiphilus IPT5]